MRKYHSHTLLCLHETIALGSRTCDPAEIVTWMSVVPALRDGWEDSILQALQPSPLQ